MPIAKKTPAKPAAKATTAPKGAAPKGSSKPAAKAAASTVADEATITVTTTLLENGKVKGEPVEARAIEIKKFVTDVAKASVGLSFTKNLGNYEAVKFNVMVSMPCYVEEIDNGFEQALDKAKEKLDDLIERFDPSAYASEDASEDPTTLGDGGTEEGSDEGEAEGGEEEELNADWVREQDRETLVNLITENELEIDPDDYTDDEEGLNDLREMIIAVAFADDNGAEEAAAEAEEAEAEGDDDAYTQEQLEEADTADLEQIYDAWEMGKFPKYTNAASEKIARKTAIKAILKRQEDAAAG